MRSEINFSNMDNIISLGVLELALTACKAPINKNKGFYTETVLNRLKQALRSSQRPL